MKDEENIIILYIISKRVFNKHSNINFVVSTLSSHIMLKCFDVYLNHAAEWMIIKKLKMKWSNFEDVWLLNN